MRLKEVTPRIIQHKIFQRRSNWRFSSDASSSFAKAKSAVDTTTIASPIFLVLMLILLANAAIPRARSRNEGGGTEKLPMQSRSFSGFSLFKEIFF